MDSVGTFSYSNPFFPPPKSWSVVWANQPQHLNFSCICLHLQTNTPYFPTSCTRCLLELATFFLGLFHNILYMACRVKHNQSNKTMGMITVCLWRRQTGVRSWVVSLCIPAKWLLLNLPPIYQTFTYLTRIHALLGYLLSNSSRISLKEKVVCEVVFPYKPSFCFLFSVVY